MDADLTRLESLGKENLQELEEEGVQNEIFESRFVFEIFKIFVLTSHVIDTTLKDKPS